MDLVSCLVLIFDLENRNVEALDARKEEIQ